MNSQIFFRNTLVHPETNSAIILHGNSTVKNKLDNFRPVTMSDFGKKIAASQSLAEVCRLLHHNYTFAKDLVDNVEWKIIGAPSVDNDKIHVTNGNYIYRTLKLGADTFDIDFDLQCTDTNKIFFQIYDNTATPASATVAYRHWYRLLLDSDGFLQFKYLLQQYANISGSGWKWQPVSTKLTKTFDFKTDEPSHITLRFGKSNDSVGVSFDSTYFYWSEGNSCPISNKTWYFYIGNTADALIGNFSVINNSVTVSQLVFS